MSNVPNPGFDSGQRASADAPTSPNPGDHKYTMYADGPERLKLDQTRYELELAAWQANADRETAEAEVLARHAAGVQADALAALDRLNYELAVIRGETS